MDWSTWTSVFGFPVQGIYSNKEEYEVTSTCVTNSKQILAVGEFSGRLCLYRFPATI